MVTEDTENFIHAAHSFIEYAANARAELIEDRKQVIENITDVGQRQSAMSIIGSSFQRTLECINHNSELTSAIARTLSSLVPQADIEKTGDIDYSTDLEHARVILIQMAREWSLDGELERQQSYSPVISALEEEFAEKGAIRVLVPGCGLGRLPWDLAMKGFTVLGNEYSCEMLLAQYTILNNTGPAAKWTTNPYIHSTSHYRAVEDMFRSVEIPDVDPLRVTDQNCGRGEMSMVCGTFNDSFDDCPDGYFDAVATVFFVDTQANIFQTVAVLSRLIKSGGLWVNFGPLHWHHERIRSNNSKDFEAGLELTVGQLLELIEKYGWKFEKHSSFNKATYCSTNPRRMSPYLYDCEFWIARRL